MAQSGVVRYLPSHRYRQWEGALPLSDDDRQREALGAVANARLRPEHMPTTAPPTTGEFYATLDPNRATSKINTYVFITVASITGFFFLVVMAYNIYNYFSRRKPRPPRAVASTTGANNCCGGGGLYFPY